MKLPSLDNAEGIVVLGAAALLTYALYKAYTVGKSIPTAVGDTISKAATDVSNTVSSIIPKSSQEKAANAMLDSDPLSTQNVTNALDARPVDGVTGSSWDGTADPTAAGIGSPTVDGSGLGVDSRTIAAPQQIAPSAINQDSGNFFPVLLGG